MRVLLLGGTSEGRELADKLAARGAEFIYSLSGATRQPRLPEGRIRRGGFGGEAGFRQFLDEEDVGAIIDATHPFAARISARTARVANALGLPNLQILRPEWRPCPGDTWHFAEDLPDAARMVEPGALVFAATGRQQIEAYAAFAHCRLVLRQIDPPEAPFPFKNGRYLVGSPPFSVEDEVALFRQLSVDYLLVKNAGGTASASKLVAARQLGLPVILLRRPAQPDCARVADVGAALDWLDRLK